MVNTTAHLNPGPSEQGKPSWLSEERYLGPDSQQKEVALQLYQTIRELPLVCPHGHVDPRLFADPAYRFASPVDLFIIPDHYILRMLYSQGISLESLGVPVQAGSPAGEVAHRRIWQTFADNFHLFWATPSGLWFREALASVFDIADKLTPATAQSLYEQILAKLQSPDFTPRRLYERFNIEVLCTTDAATDSLAQHQAIGDSGWPGRILPTFRPDQVVNLTQPQWRQQIDRLSDISGLTVDRYSRYLQALAERRAFFKAQGATATDHSALTPYTAELTAQEAETIFQRALQGQSTADEARRFTGHMLMEMARMSLDDGLVMQLHVGSYRNHNQQLYGRFGPDMGADIPVQTEFTTNLAPLLQKYGNEPAFRLILFTLDETTYARELAPLAGHYPALKLGPPWWFHDSLNGLRRYFDQVIETAGLYNTAGFNDDTRAFPSIPARHEVWRRAGVNWLAGLVTQGIIDVEDAGQMAHDLAYGLAKQAYNLPGAPEIRQ
jgi:glucuronate isomerase